MGTVWQNLGMAMLENANAVDAIVVIVCLLSALIGFWSGFVWQIIRLVSWVGALWGAGRYGGVVAGHMGSGVSGEMRAFIGFLMVFVGILLVCYVIAYLITTMVDALQLTLADRIAGGLLGVVKGLFFCGIIALAVLHFLSPDMFLNEMISQSYLARTCGKGVAILWLLLPGSASL